MMPRQEEESQIDDSSYYSLNRAVQPLTTHLHNGKMGYPIYDSSLFS